jgi:hypothetical protein
MSQIIGKADDFRLIRKSQRVRVAGIRPRLKFARPVIPFDANVQNDPVFNDSGEYSYRVVDVEAGLTDADRFRGVLDSLAASAVMIGGGTVVPPKKPEPSEPPGTEPPLEDIPEPLNCEKIQFGAEDSVIWHDKIGRHHLIYGKYITAAIPPAQYKIRVIEKNAAVTHTDKEFTIKVDGVPASPQNPVRVLYYNRVDASSKGKKFDEDRAIPLFYISGIAQGSSEPESEKDPPKKNDKATRNSIGKQAAAAGQKAFGQAVSSGQSGQQARSAFDAAAKAVNDAAASDPAEERQNEAEPEEQQPLTLVAKVFTHSFFPEVDADNDSDIVDLILWMNEICDPAKEEDKVEEPKGQIGGTFTGPDGTSSTASQSGGSDDHTTDASGPKATTDKSRTGCENSVPGEPFVPMESYPIGRVDVLRGCKRKLVHCEGQHVHLVSNTGQLNSIFMFKEPYVVIECDDGPVSPLINGDRLFVDDRHEGSKDNKSTLVYNEAGKKGDTDDLFVVAKFLTANIGQQIAAKEAEIKTAEAKVDADKKQYNTLVKNGANQAALDAQQTVIDASETAQADFEAELTQLLRADDQHRLMLRMECAPDPRGGMITNKKFVGMLRDPFILQQNFLELKTKVFFRQVDSPLQCADGGVTGPILFTDQQAPPCLEDQPESGEMDGPVDPKETIVNP